MVVRANTLSAVGIGLVSLAFAACIVGLLWVFSPGTQGVLASSGVYLSQVEAWFVTTVAAATAAVVTVAVSWVVGRVIIHYDEDYVYEGREWLWWWR